MTQKDLYSRFKADTGNRPENDRTGYVEWLEEKIIGISSIEIKFNEKLTEEQIEDFRKAWQKILAAS